MNIRTRRAGIPAGLAMVAAIFLPTAAAQKTQELTYTVGPKAVISITNIYGPITVRPSRSRQVVIKTVSHSDAVSFENQQHGNRIELRSSSLTSGTGLAEYNVLVPYDSLVALRSSGGKLQAEGLTGDVILEAGNAVIEVMNISDAHVHVKTLNGPVTLTDIRNSDLDVRCASGNVYLHNVTGSSVNVNSGSGQITYEGDPGAAGEYLLTSHSGNVRASIPASATVQIRTHSVKGESDHEIPNAGASAMGQKNLLKPGTPSASRFELRSFSGKIYVERP